MSRGDDHAGAETKCMEVERDCPWMCGAVTGHLGRGRGGRGELCIATCALDELVLICRHSSELQLVAIDDCHYYRHQQEEKARTRVAAQA